METCCDENGEVGMTTETFTMHNYDPEFKSGAQIINDDVVPLDEMVFTPASGRIDPMGPDLLGLSSVVGAGIDAIGEELGLNPYVTMGLAFVFTKGKLKKPSTGIIKGHTKHGLNQSISRNGGRGVSAKAKLDAVKNPQKVTKQNGGKTKYKGKDATVILNKDGKVITTYGKPRNPNP